MLIRQLASSFLYTHDLHLRTQLLSAVVDYYPDDQPTHGLITKIKVRMNENEK